MLEVTPSTWRLDKYDLVLHLGNNSRLVFKPPEDSWRVILFKFIKKILTMGGSTSAEEKPSEETNINTENIGLWNVSATGATYFGVGEVLTIVILILMLLVILKYYCKKCGKARRSELEQSIRSVTSAPTCGPTFSSPSACATTFSSPSVGMPIPLVTFDTPGTRTIQLSRQPMTTISPETTNIPLYWESCK